jgi:hypothetical protein
LDYDPPARTWTASDISDLNITTANNLIVHGQPYQPSDGYVFDPIISSNFQSNPTVNVQMPQSQIMEFGYGSGVQVSDFGVNSLLGSNVGLPDGSYTRQELIDSGLASSSDFSVSSQLYTPGANIADGGATAAYVHGTVQFGIGSESTFIVQDGNLVEIQADLRAFDDDFNFVSGNPIINAVNPLIQYTIGPGSDVPAGAIVLLEYRGPGRLEVVSLGPEMTLVDVLNALQAVDDEALRKQAFEAITGSEYCFGGDVLIDMWPLELEFAPDPNKPYKQYVQDAVRAKIWKKPIHQIRVGDYVVSHDKNGNVVPGYVPRTMTNDAKILLDFHGTRVTPGHVYYRPDSKKADKYETLIDILRDDGMIEYRDGVKLRAATYAPVDGAFDGFVKAITGTRKADGGVEPKDQGRVRLGTRFIVGDRDKRISYTVADLIKVGGGVVGDDELIHVGDGAAMPFHWEFGDGLPKPEDFVLACSGTTLEDIYMAAEWESQGPRLPAPMVLDRGPVQPLSGADLDVMPRNEPLTFGPTPTSETQPTLNRKQRKAMAAKQRRATTSRKRVMG